MASWQDLDFAALLRLLQLLATLHPTPLHELEAMKLETSWEPHGTV